MVFESIFVPADAETVLRHPQTSTWIQRPTLTFYHDEDEGATNRLGGCAVARLNKNEGGDVDTGPPSPR